MEFNCIGIDFANRKDIAMSLTVEKVLELPSLYGAEIVAGHSGLGNPVSSVSVLEYGRDSEILKDFFDSVQFEGNEIIITSFADIQNDVEAQCLNVRHYHAAGSAGLILFYVGIILPKIDQRLIDCCDELGFALIRMPGGITHKYADVIGDILFSVFKDHQSNTAFVSDLINRFSRLPAQQRSISSLLRMLSNHLQATVIVTGHNRAINHIACWPQSMESQIEPRLSERLKLTNGRIPLEVEIMDNIGYLQQCPALIENGSNLNIFIFNFGEPLQRNVLWQASELIQLYSHIWNENLGKFVTSELVNAILEDEPLKMRHLSNLFHINVENLNQMWVFIPRVGRHANDENLIAICKEYLSSASASVLVGYYQNNLIAFSSAEPHISEKELICGDMAWDPKEIAEKYVIARIECLDNTASVREAYANVISYWQAAEKIYPEKSIIGYPELLFAKFCHQLTQNGENLKPYISVLNRLNSGSELLHTLCCYLLDSGSNMQATANRLHCHINTIKYRLRLIRDISGYSPIHMPDAYFLHIVAAINRINLNISNN